MGCGASSETHPVETTRAADEVRGDSGDEDRRARRDGGESATIAADTSMQAEGSPTVAETIVTSPSSGTPATATAAVASSSPSSAFRRTSRRTSPRALLPEPTRGGGGGRESREASVSHPDEDRATHQQRRPPPPATSSNRTPFGTSRRLSRHEGARSGGGSSSTTTSGSVTSGDSGRQYSRPGHPLDTTTTTVDAAANDASLSALPEAACQTLTALLPPPQPSNGSHDSPEDGEEDHHMWHFSVTSHGSGGGGSSGGGGAVDPFPSAVGNASMMMGTSSQHDIFRFGRKLFPAGRRQPLPSQVPQHPSRSSPLVRGERRGGSDSSTPTSGSGDDATTCFPENPLHSDASASVTDVRHAADSVRSNMSSRPSVTSGGTAASTNFDPGDPSLRMSGVGTSISSSSITSATHRMMADVLHSVNGADEIKASLSVEMDPEE